MKRIALATTTALIISGCTATLQEINSGLSTVNNGLASVNNATSPTSPTQRAHGLYLSSAQQARLQSSLSQGTQDKNINTAIAEASPTIRGFIETNSCITAYNGSVLNRYSAPGKNYTSVNYIGAPIPKMRYHDKTSCVSVLRIQGWQMPAKNALRFEVSYTSDSSDEVVKSNHEVVKQPNGEWLFTR